MGKAIRVLIVDKETDFSDYLASFIKAKGHEAFGAKDITEVISVMEKEEPNLVLLDMLFLGTPSGLPLVEGMKRTERKRKVYLMCASPAMGEILASRIGADGVITKPFQIAEIDRLIDNACDDLQ